MTRIVLFVDPSAGTYLPIAILSDESGRVTMERIPRPRGMSIAERAVIALAWRAIEAAPSMTVLPECCGPRVVFEPDEKPDPRTVKKPRPPWHPSDCASKWLVNGVLGECDCGA